MRLLVNATLTCNQQATFWVLALATVILLLSAPVVAADAAAANKPASACEAEVSFRKLESHLLCHKCLPARLLVALQRVRTQTDVPPGLPACSLWTLHILSCAARSGAKAAGRPRHGGHTSSFLFLLLSAQVPVQQDKNAGQAAAAGGQQQQGGALQVMRHLHAAAARLFVKLSALCIVEIGPKSVLNLCSASILCWYLDFMPCSALRLARCRPLRTLARCGFRKGSSGAPTCMPCRLHASCAHSLYETADHRHFSIKQHLC